jgi:hypothetical protein
VLNAKYHEKEAMIVADAGQMGQVTIATNMAGRGTDIVLGEGVAELGGLHIYMTHKKKDLPKDLTPYDLVIYGHSHQYASTWQDYVGKHRTLLFNPGSCGPRRFIQPITMAILKIKPDGWVIKQINIPHAVKEKAPKIDSGDIHRQIEVIVKDTQKGLSVQTISEKRGLDPALVEQIVRLYVTHPGVTTEGIMTKMGLLGKL